MTHPDRIALVTGANKGLGLETTRQLAAHGVFVLMGCRDLGRGQAAAASLAGLSVEAVKLDVKDANDRQAVAELVEARFGRLDILVNNAGIAIEGGQQASRVPLEILRETFETNFFAQVALTQALLPLIRKSRAGRIVNVSSVLGSLAVNSDPKAKLGDFAQVGYNGSKCALNMFTVLLAKELRDAGVQVNSAHPGWVKTDLGSQAAPLEVEEGAKTMVDLALAGEDGPTGGFFHLGKPLPW